MNVEALLRRALPNPGDVDTPPAMVNGLVPAVSGTLEAGYDSFSEFMNWMGDQADAAQREVAARIAIGQREVEDGLRTLREAWAQLDAAGHELTGDLRRDAEKAKQGIEEGMTELVSAGEELAEETAEASENAWEQVEEGATEFIDNVGGAGEDVVNTIVGWFP
ncbi:MAG: hypothetical protein AABM67_21200 [Acidobacteriota bacterium]